MDSNPPVHYTPNTNVPYLTAPHVITLASTSMEYAQGFRTFLQDYDHTFDTYFAQDIMRSIHESADLLSKVAGQLCYLSFGPNRTKDSQLPTYLTNIKSKADGSVLEHASATFLCYGISRSCTHEIVRHRAGFAYSQVSQRYVQRPRFVERLEYQHDPYFHDLFIQRIEAINKQYNELLVSLEVSYAAALDPTRPVPPRTERLKAVRQVARSVLPNETEAPIIVTGNMRAWRHFLEQRGSQHAETEIRSLAFRIYHHLTQIAPHIFDDYTEQFTDEGVPYLDTQYRKV